MTKTKPKKARLWNSSEEFLPQGNDRFEKLNDHAPIKYPEFKTHLHYVTCLNEQSREIGLRLHKNFSSTALLESNYLRKKIKLIELTRDNLKEEYQRTREIVEYSQICVSWIPVKSYYLIFNSILVLLYLIREDEGVFVYRHAEANEQFLRLMQNNSLKFSGDLFNLIIPANKVASIKRAPIGSNINSKNFDLVDRVGQIYKILLRYKKENYKQTIKKKSLRGKYKARFVRRTSVNLCEFFYWYRIKANYRDMEFIKSEVPVGEFFEFYKNYYELTFNMYDAIASLINELALLKLKRRLV